MIKINFYIYNTEIRANETSEIIEDDRVVTKIRDKIFVKNEKDKYIVSYI